MSWRYTISKQEAALREYHASFPWRSAAVRRFTDELIAKWRANPPGSPRPASPLGEYEHPRTGEAMLDGLKHPGL
jgi:hypothetical protein